MHSAETPQDSNYGPARGLRLTADEQSMLDDLAAHYGESYAQVLRLALRRLYDSVTTPTL